MKKTNSLKSFIFLFLHQIKSKTFNTNQEYIFHGGSLIQFGDITIQNKAGVYARYTIFNFRYNEFAIKKQSL